MYNLRHAQRRREGHDWPDARCHVGMHLAMAGWLLDHGADVNKADDAGETPLMTAAGSAEPDLVELLLSRGADVAAQCKTGCTALHLAVAQGETAVTALCRCCAMLASGLQPSGRLVPVM